MKNEKLKIKKLPRIQHPVSSTLRQAQGKSSIQHPSTSSGQVQHPASLFHGPSIRPFAALMCYSGTRAYSCNENEKIKSWLASSIQFPASRTLRQAQGKSSIQHPSTSSGQVQYPTSASLRQVGTSFSTGVRKFAAPVSRLPGSTIPQIRTTCCDN